MLDCLTVQMFVEHHHPYLPFIPLVYYKFENHVKIGPRQCLFFIIRMYFHPNG